MILGLVLESFPKVPWTVLPRVPTLIDSVKASFRYPLYTILGDEGQYVPNVRERGNFSPHQYPHRDGYFTFILTVHSEDPLS